MNVQAGLAIIDTNKYMTSLRNWLNSSLIAELFFYASFFSIKLSFLLFFPSLGNRTKHFIYTWWGVLFVTAGSYFAAVGNVDYKCLVGTIEQRAQEPSRVQQALLYCERQTKSSKI